MPAVPAGFLPRSVRSLSGRFCSNAVLGWLQSGCTNQQSTNTSFPPSPEASADSSLQAHSSCPFSEFADRWIIFFPLLFLFFPPSLLECPGAEYNTLGFEICLKGNMEINWLGLLSALSTCLYCVRGAVQLPLHCGSPAATCLLTHTATTALSPGSGDGCPLPLPIVQEWGQLAGLSS